MAKVYCFVKDIAIDEGCLQLYYKALAPGSSMPEYGCNMPYDASRTLSENLTRLKQKVADEVSTHGLKVLVDEVDAIGSEPPVTGTRSFFSSLFSSPTPDPPVQEEKEDDPRFQEHQNTLDSLQHQLTHIQSAYNQIQNRLDDVQHRVIAHDHPYPEQSIQLGLEVDALKKEVDRQILQYHAKFIEIENWLIRLEPPPIPEPVVEELVIPPQPDIIEEAAVSEPQQKEPSPPSTLRVRVAEAFKHSFDWMMG